MSNNNGHTPWGTPQEINRSAFPVGKAQSKFEMLFVDIVMRLEQTNGSKALMYPFKTEQDAKSASVSIANLFSRRIGKGQVVTRAGVARDGSPALYVMRGPNYVK